MGFCPQITRIAQILILNYPLGFAAFVAKRRKNYPFSICGLLHGFATTKGNHNYQLSTVNYPLGPQGRFCSEAEKELSIVNYQFQVSGWLRPSDRWCDDICRCGSRWYSLRPHRA